MRCFYHVSRFRHAAIALAALAIAACTPQVDHRGYTEDTPIREQITINTSNKQDVQAILGSPSSTSSFGEEKWYYIRAAKQARGPLKPKLIDQHVTEITFDESGNVSAIKEYGQKDGKQVAMVDKITPTEGHSLGFFEQLLGNLGRFNNSKRGISSAAAAGGRGGY